MKAIRRKSQELKCFPTYGPMLRKEEKSLKIKKTETGYRDKHSGEV